MRTFLLNIGFIESSDGTYYNNEIELRVRVIINAEGNEALMVPTPQGEIESTVEELEDVIVSGGFGDF